jgi:MarR family 2-MHQ and catechol resistance regulon transcriptional repressor
MFYMYYSSMNDMAPTQPDGAAASANVMAVLHAAHAVEAKLEAACGRAGLSMAKFSVLSQLVEAGRLSCVRSNMTQLIDRLESEGFVRRVNCPTDRRSVKAEITELGKDRQAVAAEEFAKVNAEIVGLVQPEDHAAFERFARALG